MSAICIAISELTRKASDTEVNLTETLLTCGYVVIASMRWWNLVQYGRLSTEKSSTSDNQKMELLYEETFSV